MLSLAWKSSKLALTTACLFSLSVLILLPAYGQSQTSKAFGIVERPKPVTNDQMLDEKTALLTLAEEVYIHSLAAQRIQRDCRIMNQIEFDALRWHTKEIRKYLTREKGLSALSSLQLQARKMTASDNQPQRAKGLYKCNKELMLELAGILEQAEFAASSVGGEPFNDRAAALNQITTVLKKAARLKGAFMQCGADKPQDEFTTKKLAELNKNTLVLSAIAMVNGANATLFGRLSSIQQQTANTKRWKSECKLHKLQAINKTLKTIIASYKEQ